MTIDELNALTEINIVDVQTRDYESEGMGLCDIVVFGALQIKKSQWDAALASADDALVFVQWLESKRTD